MKLNFINDWQYIMFFEDDNNGFYGNINNDIDLIDIHVEFNTGYLGFWFILFGFGVELVLIHK